MATSTRASAVRTAALLAEHRELRETLAGLERDLLAPPTLESVLDWCEIVLLRLRMLRAHLQSHFAQEEKGGLIEEIQRSAPEQQELCERLRREHARLLDKLDWLATQATLRIEPGRWAGGLEEMLADLARHEERESELLLRALDATPGAPD
jgi:predicted protein tyrosine phosphatase